MNKVKELEDKIKELEEENKNLKVYFNISSDNKQNQMELFSN